MNPILALTVTAALAGAPPTAEPAPRLRMPAPELYQPSARAVTATASARAFRGDSLNNGILIGAIVGAAGFGGFIFTLCNALDETEGSEDCVKAALVAGGIGAAGGGLIGAGLDAVVDRKPAWEARRSLKPAFRVRVRF